MRSFSITRRLTLTVLVLEVVSAVALIGAITFHERHQQLKAFDATLQGKADSLMGAVQDADDPNDNVLLDVRGLSFSTGAVFRVEENGRVLGAVGDVPPFRDLPAAGSVVFRNVEVQAGEYRCIILHGLRIVDPNASGGGVRHSVTVIYGAPVKQIWREVLESVRFVVVATLILLSLTAVVMVVLLRRGLSPLHELAGEAERVTFKDWRFASPPSAKQTEELRPLAVALEGAVARLERSFAQQKRFTSDAAHELKTDIAIVKSSIQLLAMRDRTAQEYKHGIGQILADFTRLEATVQTMLTLARLEQPVQAAHQTCLLRDVIEEAVFQNKAVAEMQDLQVKVEVVQEVEVPVDRRDALLLFGNVLTNALQHSPSHSSVAVHTTFESGVVNLTIQDEGEGVAAEDLPHVFEPFYRGDVSRARKNGGTGLGLSIAKAICERAGGSIAISNQIPSGALVKITLPARVAALDDVSSASIK